MNSISRTVAALGIVSVCGAAVAGSLVIDPASKLATVGDSFDLMVQGQGFAENLVSGGFDLSFDGGVLQLTGVSIHPSWEFEPKTGVINNGLGTLTDAGFQTFSTHTGNFDAAVLSFVATGSGNTTVSLLPSAFFVFADEDVNVVMPTFAGAAVRVSAIDEASTAATMLAGLALLTTVLRRGRRRG
jgi:hypothetical protein